MQAGLAIDKIQLDQANEKDLLPDQPFHNFRATK